ncbi:MAG: ATP-binding cassette domain-containing protein [Candidatus Sulfotelmatobacter sp.]
MISFANINKQYGKQLIFVDASFQLNPGEQVGLVGPNGAGKTTLFRMVVGEESSDHGTVSVPKKLTIGYFRQDVEEMQGRSVAVFFDNHVRRMDKLANQSGARCPAYNGNFTFVTEPARDLRVVRIVDELQVYYYVSKRADCIQEGCEWGGTRAASSRPPVILSSISYCRSFVSTAMLGIAGDSLVVL